MMRPVVDIASGRQTPLNAQHQRLPDTGGVSNVTLMVCRAALTAACSSRSLLARFKPLRQPTRKGVYRMHRPDQPPAPPARAAPTSRWRRRVFYYTGGLALIVIGALIGLMGLIKVQGVIIPLNIELREGAWPTRRWCRPEPRVRMRPRRSCDIPTGAPRSSGELPRRSSGAWPWPPNRSLRPSGGAAWGICWWRCCWWRVGSRRSSGSWSAVGDGASGASPGLVARPPAHPPGEASLRPSTGSAPPGRRGRWGRSGAPSRRAGTAWASPSTTTRVSRPPTGSLPRKAYVVASGNPLGRKQESGFRRMLR